MMSPLRPKSMHHEKKWCLRKFQHWFNIFVHLGMKKHMLIPERNCTAVICVLSWATPGPLWPAQVVFPKGFVHAWSSLSCLRKPNPRTPIQISCGSLKPTTSQNFQNCQLSTGANRNYGTMNHVAAVQQPETQQKDLGCCIYHEGLIDNWVPKRYPTEIDDFSWLSIIFTIPKTLYPG